MREGIIQVGRIVPFIWSGDERGQRGFSRPRSTHQLLCVGQSVLPERRLG